MFKAAKRKQAERRLLELAGQIGADRAVNSNIQDFAVSELQDVLYESTARHFPNDGDVRSSLYLNLMNLAHGLDAQTARSISSKLRAETDIDRTNVPSVVAKELVRILIEASKRAEPALVQGLHRDPSQTLRNKDVDFLVRVVSIFQATLIGREAEVLAAEQRYNPHLEGYP